MRLGRLVVVLLALSSCSSPPGRRNVILVSVDTLRADYLSCYGSKEASTPGFDRIAREGLQFENAASVAPTTLPAHASLLTGTSPLEPRRGARPERRSQARPRRSQEGEKPRPGR